MWNTAIVGDNDFMYHRVERIGYEGTSSPTAIAASTLLDHDGSAWIVTDAGRELGCYEDREVRLSISWKATVDADEAALTSVEDAFDRVKDAIGTALAATAPASLFDEPSRIELMHRWPGFLPVGVT